jgi:hypothetical protein
VRVGILLQSGNQAAMPRWNFQQQNEAVQVRVYLSRRVCLPRGISGTHTMHARELFYWRGCRVYLMPRGDRRSRGPAVVHQRPVVLLILSSQKTWHMADGGM